MTQQPTNVLLMASSMRGGGSEKQVLLLAQHLDREHFRPHLYLSETHGALLGRVPDDVPVIGYDRNDHSRGFYVPGEKLRRQTNFLREIIGQHAIDVVYDRTFHMTLLAGVGASRVRRVATIVSPPHQAVPFVEQRFVGLKRRRLASAYRHANAVVAVSHAAAASAEAYYHLKPGSVIVIPNPFDPASLATQTITRSKNNGSTSLVCVARMTEEKGHADLIEALTAVNSRWPSSRKPWKIRLIGDGPLRERLQAHVDRFGLTRQVSFIGAVDPAGEEIAAADALVLPSRFEGMPNVVLEAMAVGTPVIATRSGGTAELQADRPTAFWADPGNPTSLAEAILQFAHHPDQAAEQRDTAKRYVLTHHDLRSIIKQIEALLGPE